MIYIDDSKLKSLSKEYVQTMMPIVEANYTKFKNSSNSPRKDYVLSFFENQFGNFDVIKVQCLLTEPLETSCVLSSEIEEYFMLNKFIFYSDFKISKELKKLNKNLEVSNKRDFIKQFVSTYHTQRLQDYIIRTQIDYSYSAKNLKELVKVVSSEMKQVNKGISYIINYSDTSKRGYQTMPSDVRHRVISGKDISVCPYCNRQYITNYFDGAFSKPTADLDHFYPQSIFPLFAYSLYNFVPSCQICNQRFKKTVKKQLVYPYKEGFNNNCIFKLEIDKSKGNFDTIVGCNDFFEIDFKVDENSPIASKINNNIELFRLKALYKNHKSFVRELLYKRTAYSHGYKGVWEDFFKQMNLYDESIDIFKYGFELNEDEFVKKPLSKLAHDVIKHN